jgi:protein phosphatase
MQAPEFGHATHTGWRREHNEDSYLVDPELGLWIVADGLGGEADGEVASAIVVAHVAQCLHAGMPLAQALTSSHAAVRERCVRGAVAPVCIHCGGAAYQGERL